MRILIREQAFQQKIYEFKFSIKVLRQEEEFINFTKIKDTLRGIENVTIVRTETSGDSDMIGNSLAANVWTQHLAKAHRIANALDFGIVWINCWLVRDLRTPFGGMKDSGVGREGGFEALRFFTETKNVCVKF